MNALSNVSLSLPDIKTLGQALHNGDKPLPTFRNALNAADAILRRQFLSGAAVDSLVYARAHVVDAIIGQANKLYLNIKGLDLALVAVGGYGRGELHPYSDIDLLILLDNGYQKRSEHAIGEFIAFLWDIGLHASHSVRILEECLAQAQMNVTVATNLLEARYIAGNHALFSRLQQQIMSDKFWPAEQFFAAKRREQQKRHAKYHETAYRLEPNLKEGPGGLRDIQMIAWVAKRHFRTDTIHSLVEHGFLSEDEYQSLCKGQYFLWRTRFALHLIHGRCEDRLLFDSQVSLAEKFGYRNTPEALAVEYFMQDYYQTIKELGLLNEMLLQLLEEAIFKTDPSTSVSLNDMFEERGGFLYVGNVELFAQRPAAMLELFLILEQHPHFRGVSASALRLLRANLQRIDASFRSDPANRALFMQILREPLGVTHELRRMNLYGVLGRYLPAFGKIIGRMQYDLFHSYTVDEHILFVISNLRRFALARYDHEFPLCSKIMQALAKPELVYLGALFHDIAKGRGGDHSKLGAEEARVFCLEHGLGRYDAHLVAWLVEHHLLLSLTAQKKDIHDPRVIHAFAEQVGDQMRLDCLYLLTVADIRGTNPDLWNSWKARLCVELYQNASHTLLHGLENPIDKEELIGEIQQDVLHQLREQGIDLQVIHTMWKNFSDEYFVYHAREEIVWHAACFAGRLVTGNPLVFLRRQTVHGGTAVCIHSSHDESIFGRVTAALAELGLTVLDARMTPMKCGDRLDTYVILEENGEPISDDERLLEIELVLRREIHRCNALPITVTRRAPRQVRMFTTPTRVQFADDPDNRRTVLEISAADRPGLLSIIGQTFGKCRVHLQNAKITTVGERAEDVFFITDYLDQPINDPAARERLQAALIAQLSEPA